MAHDQNGESRNRILFVGPLTKASGFSRLIGACQRLLDRGRDFELIAVAEELDEDQTRAAIPEGLASRVQIHQASRPGADDDAFKDVTVFAEPSGQLSSAGQSALEKAMAMGVPPIVAVGGTQSVIIEDGFNGFLIPGQGEEALAETLEVLLSDPYRAQAVGRSARWTVEARLPSIGPGLASLDQPESL